MAKLVLLGGGRMGEALLAGLLASGAADADELAVVEKIAARREELQDIFPGVDVVAGMGELSAIESAVVAVKPGDVPSVCEVLGRYSPRRVLSIAAGVTTAALEAAMGGRVPVVRAMPNTPALVGAGAAAIAGGEHADDDDLAWAEGILGAVGTVVRVPEGSLDAVTGLSGSGPAYVFLIAESLIDAGVLAGLPRATSEQLALQTLLGAARMLLETGDDAARLRANVTSPGGTTAAGLRVLEQAGVRAAFLDAVQAATERSRHLGRG